MSSIEKLFLSKFPVSIEGLSNYESELARHISVVASEIRKIDSDMLSFYIREKMYRSLDCLISSAAELHFRRNTLMFAWSATAANSWSSGPSFNFEMEFASNQLHILFCLTVKSSYGEVGIRTISFDNTLETPSVLDVRNALLDAQVI